MNSFHSFKYILLALYKLLANPEDLMHTPKLYNGGFLNTYKKHKNLWLNKIMTLKKNKQNQPEKNSVSIFTILIFIKYCGFESNLIAEKGKLYKETPSILT